MTAAAPLGCRNTLEPLIKNSLLEQARAQLMLTQSSLSSRLGDVNQKEREREAVEQRGAGVKKFKKDLAFVEGMC